MLLPVRVQNNVLSADSEEARVPLDSNSNIRPGLFKMYFFLLTDLLPSGLLICKLLPPLRGGD